MKKLIGFPMLLWMKGWDESSCDERYDEFELKLKDRTKVFLHICKFFYDLKEIFCKSLPLRILQVSSFGGTYAESVNS
jgi:hypothetical protein